MSTISNIAFIPKGRGFDPQIPSPGCVPGYKQCRYVKHTTLMCVMLERARAFVCTFYPLLSTDGNLQLRDRKTWDILTQHCCTELTHIKNMGA